MISNSHFSFLQRALHWNMAAMIIAMLFIGVGMVTTIRPIYLTFLHVHEGLGILILLLAAIRLFVRIRRGAPPLPTTMPLLARVAAIGSHYVLYALMFSMPLIGWAMVSSAGSPIHLDGISIRPLMDIDEQAHAFLLKAHVWLGLSFFALILLHLSAALSHGWVRRDDVLASMTRGPAHETGESINQPTLEL